jgi:ribose transport system substrate-binding protein
VDGIAISTLNADFLTETINRAVDAGIPVVTWDSDAPRSKRQAFYGVDDFESGRIMGGSDQAARRQRQGRHHHERRRHQPRSGGSRGSRTR